MFLFLVLLPSWIRIRWFVLFQIKDIPFFKGTIYRQLVDFIRGILNSLFLIICILFILNFTPWIGWRFELNFGDFLNATLLCFLVGISEEMIFRGWLSIEMNYLMGYKFGNFFQALIFSLVHLRLDMSFLETILTLTGLFVFGLVLAQRRNLDQGSLWGCIGLHGGLVANWFLIQNCFVNFNLQNPSWLFGPGAATPNPIGGVLGILLLLSMLFYLRFLEVTSRRRSFLGTDNASSNGANP